MLGIILYQLKLIILHRLHHNRSDLQQLKNLLEQSRRAHMRRLSCCQQCSRSDVVAAPTTSRGLRCTFSCHAIRLWFWMRHMSWT